MSDNIPSSGYAALEVLTTLLKFLQSEALQLPHHMEMQLVRMLATVLL